ncbi:MAG: hypothetical protein JXB10_14505 [Pirellulales bacterium]|nr:hypothetical protein [Pirellulales bacterium]
MRIITFMDILAVSAMLAFQPATAIAQYLPQSQVVPMGYAPNTAALLMTSAAPAPAVPPAPGINTAAVAAPAPIAPQDDTDYYTLDQLKGEMKKLVWKKGDFSITPYGFLWANMVYESQVSNTGDYALYIFSPTDRDYEAFQVDGRSTRLGFDVTGPKIWGLNCANSGGKIEFDFQGDFTYENKGGVLLRHAYWEVKDEYFRLLGGQTWDIISPLYPGTIMYSVYWGAGNIGYRRAQFRGERYFHLNDRCLFTVQGSINGTPFLDTATYPTTVVKDHSGWPTCEGRIAMTLGSRGKDDHPIELGVSGHVGEHRYSIPGVDPDGRFGKTWSFNVDLKAPVNERLGFQGEFYTGENLSTFLGGILQGYNFALGESIYDTGGWMEVYYFWTPRLHTHVGYTLDDPLDRQIASGGRTYNQAYWGNLIYNVTPKFQVGLEVGQWETVYKDKLPGDSTRVEFMARYGF